MEKKSQNDGRKLANPQTKEGKEIKLITRKGKRVE